MCWIIKGYPITWEKPAYEVAGFGQSPLPKMSVPFFFEDGGFRSSSLVSPLWLSQGHCQKNPRRVHGVSGGGAQDIHTTPTRDQIVALSGHTRGVQHPYLSGNSRPVKARQQFNGQPVNRITGEGAGPSIKSIKGRCRRQYMAGVLESRPITGGGPWH